MGQHDTEQAAKGKFLDQINRGALNPHSNMLVSEFVERIYFPQFVDEKLRASTRKQYHDIWEDHSKGRMNALTLRAFRTVHGE